MFERSDQAIFAKKCEEKARLIESAVHFICKYEQHPYSRELEIAIMRLEDIAREMRELGRQPYFAGAEQSLERLYWKADRIFLEELRRQDPNTFAEVEGERERAHHAKPGLFKQNVEPKKNEIPGEENPAQKSLLKK